MDLEPHEVERMDCNCQEVRQGRLATGGNLDRVVIDEAVEQMEDEAEDWGRRRWASSIRSL